MKSRMAMYHHDFLCITVAAACLGISQRGRQQSCLTPKLPTGSNSTPRRCKIIVGEEKTYLVIWENQRIGDDHILRSSGGEDHHLCNVLGGQRFTSTEARISFFQLHYDVSESHARVNSICFGLVAIKPDDGEFLWNFSSVTLSKLRFSCALRFAPARDRFQ